MDVKALTPSLQEINCNFSNINAGGCGEFALALGRHFAKHNIKFKYLLISYRNNENILSSTRNFHALPEDIKTNMSVLHEYNYCICHIMIYYKGHFIDSTGVHETLETTRWSNDIFSLSSIISENYLSAWCETGRWNEMFDKDNIPKIKKEIEKIKLN